jgi:hypothetical protein
VIWVSLFLFQAKIFWLVDVIDYTA